MSTLPSLVDQTLRNCQRLQDYFEDLLEQVGREILESVTREHPHLDANTLYDKHGGPVVAARVDREFLSAHTYGKCQGLLKDGSKCSRRARPNGFCRTHADQYPAYQAKQRALRDMMRTRAQNPAHTHPPTQHLIEGCPMCERRKKQENPFANMNFRPAIPWS